MPPNRSVRKLPASQDIEVVGQGETVENSFCEVARIVFSLENNVDQVHLTQIITFEFKANDSKTALTTWLNLLMNKSAEHQLNFGDFRLKKEENLWRATVSGEKQAQKKHLHLSFSAPEVNKVGHFWQAKCSVALQSI